MDFKQYTNQSGFYDELLTPKNRARPGFTELTVVSLEWLVPGNIWCLDDPSATSRDHCHVSAEFGQLLLHCLCSVAPEGIPTEKAPFEGQPSPHRTQEHHAQLSDIQPFLDMALTTP